jgi:hypothetical protein
MAGIQAYVLFGTLHGDVIGHRLSRLGLRGITSDLEGYKAIEKIK